MELIEIAYKKPQVVAKGCYICRSTGWIPASTTLYKCPICNGKGFMMVKSFHKKR
jgi:DNA-directed RNA polymerase subunit RPC12/RpoP